MATVTFNKLIQDSQDFGSNDDHMISRAYFTISYNKKLEETYVDIKQLVGGSFERDELEISYASDFNRPVNFEALRRRAETYYRNVIGQSGSGINFPSGSKNIRMRNNTFNKEQAFEIPMDAAYAGW